MKRLALSLAALAFSQLATAATVPQQLLDTNTQACQQIASTPQAKQFDPYTPSDKAKVPAYCSCVSQKYWSSVPQGDFDGMMQEAQQGNMKGPHGLAVQHAVRARMLVAQKSCGA